MLFAKPFLMRRSGTRGHESHRNAPSAFAKRYELIRYMIIIQYNLVIKIARRRRENFGGLSLQYLNDLVVFTPQNPSKTIKNVQNLLKF